MKHVAPREHPDPNLIAAFVKGRLEGLELQTVSDHLSDCGECRSVTGTAAAFDNEEHPEARKATRSWWIAAAAAAAAIAIGVAIPRWFDPLRALQPDDYRSYQGRVTTFGYAPYRALRAAEASKNLRRLAAAADLQEAVQRDHSATNLHRLGVAQIALGNIEDAIRLLDEASRLEPANAAILSDLSSALLAGGRAEDAAETAARALHLDSRLAPAAFNLALALEAVSNRPQAAAAWERFLALDGTSGWAGDARDHLARLRERAANWQRDQQILQRSRDRETVSRIALAYPQRTRAWLQQELLRQCVKERREQDYAAASAIADARARAGDPFVRDVIRHAAATPTDAMQAALDAFARAAATSRSHKTEQAAVEYKDAAKLLAGAGSPLALEADALAASNDFYNGNAADALERLARVETIARRYPAVMSEIEWTRGMIAARGGRQDGALASYRRAAEYAKASGETEYEVAIAGMLANHIDRMGDSTDATQARLDLLRRSHEIDASADRMYVAYSQAALAELRAGRPRLALTFIDSQQKLATEAGDPLLLAESEAARALACRDLQQYDGAVAALTAARSYAPRIKTTGLRDRVTSDIDFIDATVHAVSEPGRALAAVDAALLTWRKYQWSLRSATARLVRGNIELALDDRDAAERDYRAGIDEIERERASLQEPMLRLAYFEQADSLFDRLALLLIRAGRPVEALSIVEKKRARVLLDRLERLDGRSAAPMSANAVAAALPDAVALIEVAFIEDRMYVWLISHGEVRFTQSPATQHELAARLSAFRQSIASNDEEGIRSAGSYLFDRIIAPFDRHLGGVTSLVIVPDAELYRLPVAALVTPESRFLVERFSLSVCPSASSFVRTLGHAAGASSILAVAEPFAGPSLPRLPNAEAEAVDVSRMYRTSAVFVGDQITPADFIRKAREAGVIHFSGHASGIGSPPSPALVFGSPERVLRPGDIAKERLEQRPIVVVAACDTTSGKLLKTEGVDSLAAAFLYAGARAVVGTLWDVDDSLSTALFGRLHRNIAGGSGASQALQRAQLSMIHSADVRERRVSSWAVAICHGTVQ